MSFPGPGSFDLPPRPNQQRGTSFSSNSPLSPTSSFRWGSQGGGSSQKGTVNSPSLTSHNHLGNDGATNSSENSFPPLTSEATKTPTSASKKKGKKSMFAKQFIVDKSLENPQTQSPLLSLMPDELLIHVFAALNPDMIKLCQSVCQRWNRIIRDEGCWRSAFQYYFRMLPVWRLRPASWKAEYLARVSMTKLYQKGKTAIQVDPRIGGLTEIHFDEDEGRTYLASTEKGVVAICHISTGKIERDTIYASTDAVSIPIGAVKVEKSRIAVGLLDGHVRLITQFKDRNNYSVHEFDGFHDGPVTCLDWLQGNPHLFLSGGFDSQVRLWDVSRLGCAAVLQPPENKPSPIVSIHVDRRHVIAGTQSGAVFIWDLDPLKHISKSSGLDSFKRSGNLTPPELITAQIPCSRVLKPEQVHHSRPIRFLEYNSLLEIAFVVLKDDPVVYFWNVAQGKLLDTFSLLDAGITISSMYYSPDPSDSEFPSFGCLLIGDSSGSVSILQAQDKSLLLIRQIKDAHDTPISCVAADSFKVVSVAKDGKVKIWNMMTGTLIRSLNVKNLHRALPQVETVEIPQPNALHSFDEIPTHIRMNEHVLIVTVGTSLKVWAFEPSQHTSQSKKKKASVQGPKMALPPARSLRTATRSQRSEYMLDLRDSVRKTRQELDAEKESRGININHIETYNGSDLTRMMTEEELISYAMMISVEDQHAGASGVNGSPSTSSSLLRPYAIPGAGSLRGSPSVHPTIPIQASSFSSTSARLGTSYGSRGHDGLISSSFGSTRSGGGRLSNSYRSSLMDKLEHEDEWDDEHDDRVSQDPELMHYMSPPSRGREGLDEDPWIDDFQLSPSIARPLPPSGGRRKISIGSGGRHAATVSGSAQENFQARSSSSAAADWLKRSPRISHTRQGGSNVMVVPRQNQYDEDDELQYVLELSMHEK